MATTTIASQLFTAGDHTYGPATKSAGQSLVSIQMAAPTDWQSGAAGRVITVKTQHFIGGQWLDMGGGNLVSPNMGHAGAFPTITETDISNDPVGTQYQLLVNFSANVTCGWNIIVN